MRRRSYLVACLIIHASARAPKFEPYANNHGSAAAAVETLARELLQQGIVRGCVAGRGRAVVERNGWRGRIEIRFAIAATRNCAPSARVRGVFLHPALAILVDDLVAGGARTESHRQ